MVVENKSISSASYQGLDQSFYSLDLLLNPTYVIEKIRHNFLGEESVGDPRDNRWEKKGTPLMKEDGVKELMQLISGTFNIPVVLGNLSEAEYKRIVADLGYTVVDFIFFNAQKYGIDHSNYNLILSIIMTDFQAFLSRTRGGFQQQHITKSWGGHEIVEQKHKSQDEENKGQVWRAT